MSEYQEFTGKTVEEALRNAREAFGAGLDDLDFEILTPGSRGVLGMGAEPARIVAAPRSALGGAAPKRDAAASAPLPPPPARERGAGDRERGPGGYRGAPGGSRDDRGPRDDRGFRDDRRRTGAPPPAGYRDDRPPREDRPPRDDRPPRPMPVSSGDESAVSGAAASATASAAAASADAGRNLADAGRVRDRASGRGGPGGSGGLRGSDGRTGSGPGGRPPRGGAPRGGAPRAESGGGSPRAALSAAEIAELVAARSSGVERDEEDTEASPEALAAGQEILSELMRHLGFNVRVDIETGQTSRLNVVGEGDEKEALGALIGRKGERLSALQHLVNLMLSRRMDTWTRVLVDVEDYRGRRERQLRDLATRAAERVIETGKMLQLEPMPALERRWIHIALRDHPDVATQSIGEEPNRRVVVVPRAI